MCDASYGRIVRRHWARLAVAYEELQRTVQDLPPLNVLADELSDAIRQAEVLRINSVAVALGLDRGSISSSAEIFWGADSR